MTLKHICATVLVFIVVLFQPYLTNTSAADLDNSYTDYKIRLQEDLVFAKRVITGFLSKRDIDNLMDLNVRPIVAESRSPLKLLRNDGPPTEISTCRQFTELWKRGAYFGDPWDNLEGRPFVSICGLLVGIKEASEAKTNYVKDKSILDLRLVPVSILPSYTDHERKALELDSNSGRTIEDYFKMGRAIRGGKSLGKVNLAFGEELPEHGWNIGMQEMARADFDGDGYEDIFVHYRASSIRGNLNFSENYLFSMKSENQERFDFVIYRIK